MEQTTLILLMAVIAALLMVLTILTCTQRRAAQRSISDALQQHQAADQQAMQQLTYQLFEELDNQKHTTDQALQQLNDRVLSTLNQLGQSQSALLETVQRQILLSTRNQEERFGSMSSDVTTQLTALDARLAQYHRAMSDTKTALDAQLTALRQDNDRQLTEMRRTVDEKLSATLDKRLNDSFAQVSARLEQVYKGLGEMQNLAVGVGDLKKVLTNVKTRGIWGEMQMGALLSQVLTREQYAENVEVVPGSGERVEFAVRLPGKTQGAVWLPIDSKFPQEDYLRLVEASQAGNTATVESARKALAVRIRTEAKRIATKYIRPPHSTDFAILFLPVEALYAEVMRDMDLAEALQRDERIVIAGPSTFAALLNALQMGFRTLAIEQRSGEVWQLLGAVKNDFDRFADTLEKTQQRLRQATESVDTAFTRTRSIQRRLSSVADTAAALGELPDAPDDSD